MLKQFRFIPIVDNIVQSIAPVTGIHLLRTARDLVRLCPKAFRFFSVCPPDATRVIEAMAVLACLDVHLPVHLADDVHQGGKGTVRKLNGPPV